MYLRFILLTNIFVLLVLSPIQAQDTTKMDLSLGADVVSHYVWRGLLYSASPNIQPYLGYTNNSGSLNVGVWSSYSLSDFYSEVDFYVGYTVGPVSVYVWDYFTMGEGARNGFFDYDKDSTMHAIEGTLLFSGFDEFPLQLTLATFFYGNDRDESGDNFYSTYIEAAYPLKWKDNELNLFMGVTPAEGLYGSEFTVCNLGLSHHRQVQITNNFALPVSGSLILNPHLENIYFVFTVNISPNN